MGGRASRKIGGREAKKRSCCRETSLPEPSMIRTCSQSAGVTMSFESASTRSKPGPHKTRSSNAGTWLGRSRRCPAFRRGCLPRFRALCHRLGCRYLLRPVQWRSLGRRKILSLLVPPSRFLSPPLRRCSLPTITLSLQGSAQQVVATTQP